jgi:hypothetical protein
MEGKTREVCYNNTARGKMEHVPEKINEQLSRAGMSELPPVVFQIGWPCFFSNF